MWTFYAVLFAAWAAMLSYYDLRYRRLPNWLTVPGFFVALCFATLTQTLFVSFGAGLLWAGLYGAASVIKRGTVGGGDIKLAAAGGAIIAVSARNDGWWQLVENIALAVVISGFLTAVVGLSAAVWTQLSDSRHVSNCGPGVAHGPSMLAAIAVVAW